MKDHRALTVCFKSVSSDQEQEYLKARGAVDPEKYRDGFRFAGPRWQDPAVLFPAVKDLIFFKSAAPNPDDVRAISSECSITPDGRFAFLPWDVVPEVFREALTEGAKV